MILAERTSCISCNSSPEAFDEMCEKHGMFLAVFVPILFIFSPFKGSNSVFVYRATQGDVSLFADSNSNSDLVILMTTIWQYNLKQLITNLNKIQERRLVLYVSNETSSLFHTLAIIRRTIERIYSLSESVLKIVL